MLAIPHLASITVKYQYLKKEIKYLLENDYVKPSIGDWSSPYILFPKPDENYINNVKTIMLQNLTLFQFHELMIALTIFVMSKFELLIGFRQVPLT